MNVSTGGSGSTAGRQGRGAMSWMLPLALLVMVIELVVIAQLVRTGTTNVAADGDVSSGAGAATSPTAAAAAAAAQPSRTPTATPQPTATTTASESKPAAGPPTETPVPPTITPLPQSATAVPPTATTAPQPPPAPAAPAQRAPAPPAAGGAGPAQAVASFYSLVEQHRFDQARQLWSARMQANYPPGENLHGRFSQVQSLTLQRLDVVGIDPAAGRATVAVDLIEVRGSPPTRQRWVGTWQLVRGQSGWLLDNPSLRPG